MNNTELAEYLRTLDKSLVLELVIAAHDYVTRAVAANVIDTWKEAA